jgi:cell division protein FtsB
MSIESLTYADLAGRLGTSHEAARSLVRRLRLPRQMGDDGTVRVNIDLAEIQYKPLPQRSPGGQRVDFEALKARIEQLQAQVTKLETEKSSIEAIAVGHRAGFRA